MSSTATPVIDSVANAEATPEKEQPYAALGLKADEYHRIREILGRRPTSGELAMYSVMWSEHCSYKSSQGVAAAVRAEGHARDEEEPHGRHGRERRRHRHRRGLGGHLQDREPQPPELHRAVPGRRDRRRRHRARHHLDGRAAGRRHGRPAVRRDRSPGHRARASRRGLAASRFYGNCLGLPNIGGETWFDPIYQANPLVNALAVGVLRHEDLHLANARGVGNKVVLFGARTGGDGIGGASILASDTFSAGRPDQASRRAGRRPVRREGAHRVLPRAVRGRAWSRASRISARPASRARRASSASNGDGGMAVELDEVLLRDPSLTAEEILMSESQERMMAIVEPVQARGLPRGHGQVGCRDQRARRGHRHRAARHHLARRDDRRRRPAHGRGRRPGVRATARLPGLARRGAGRHGIRAPPSDRRAGAQGAAAAAARQRQPRRQELDHQPVRPLRARQHRAELPRRRRHGARRRDVGPRLRGRDGCQRPLLLPRPVPGRAARARRGVPQRRRDRRDARRPSPTASTSAARRTPRSCGSSRRPSRDWPTDASRSASR